MVSHDHIDLCVMSHSFTSTLGKMFSLCICYVHVVPFSILKRITFRSTSIMVLHIYISQVGTIHSRIKHCRAPEGANAQRTYTGRCVTRVCRISYGSSSSIKRNLTPTTQQSEQFQDKHKNLIPSTL